MIPRSHLFLALAAGALVAATQLVGCSSTDDRNEPPDAGAEPDAGQPDGGDTADAGEDPVDHALGAACAADENLEQGDCDDGLQCITESTALGAFHFPGGVCTKTCTTDADCAPHGRAPNRCRTLGANKFCLRGCEPGTNDACERDDTFACNTDDEESFCYPSCNVVAAVCDAGSRCEAETGLCRRMAAYEPCPSGTCGPGLECVSFTGGSNAICLQDCTRTGCPDGFTCGLPFGNKKLCTKDCGDPSDEACPAAAPKCVQAGPGVKACITEDEPGTRTSYQTCSDRIGFCVEGAECRAASPNAASGICFVDCNDDPSVCSANEQCIEVSTIGGLCLRPCGTGCPSGTTCNNGYCWLG